MKSIILTTFIFCSIGLFSQNNLGKLDDYNRLTLAAYVPQQLENMPEIARNQLGNKLIQLISQAGMSGSAYSERFIITVNFVVLSKDITPTVPPMQAFTFNINYYIGDGIDGTMFSSYSGTVKGVGENETKAYISAIKNISVNDPGFQPFLEKGKNRIIQYYNSKCDFIIKEAQTLASQNQFEAAIYKLTSVPDVCKDCFNKAMDAVAPIYKKKIDRDCQKLLTAANTIWAANQTVNAANEVAELLYKIEPGSACYSEIKPLVNKISARIFEVDKREWKYIMREQEQKSELIKAYRDIGVAWGNGQPKSIMYNIRGWW